MSKFELYKVTSIGQLSPEIKTGFQKTSYNFLILMFL